MRAITKLSTAASGVDTALPLAVDPTVFALTDPDSPIVSLGFCGAEPEGRWTDGEIAELCIPLGWISTDAPVLLISIELRPFLAAGALPYQPVHIAANDVPVADWQLRHAGFRKHVIAVDRTSLNDSPTLNLRFELSDHAQPSAFGLNNDDRWLGVMVRRLTVEGASEMPSRNSLFWHHGRYVGGETEKSFDARIENGFWSRFVCGPDVLDVRYRGFVNDALPVFDGATGIELDDLEHDGKRLPFGDSSHDVVFANHCLHHIAGHIGALQDWHRVTRAGGHIIIAVPSAALYEKKVRPPSRWGQTPQRFYSPASLLAEIETALAPNTYRVRFLEEDDTAYSYAGGVDTLPTGCHELIAVLEKITPPRWTPEA